MSVKPTTEVQPIVRSTIRNIGGYTHGDQFVICPACSKEVGLTSSWRDEYQGSMQVHYDCLSDERKAELSAMRK